MGWPQITIIALLAIGFGINAAKDGEPRKGNYSIITSAIAVSLEAAILYAGGFFVGILAQ